MGAPCSGCCGGVRIVWILVKPPVQLTVANDKGTSDGARDAVEKLKSEGVQGIIISSSGEHIKGATSAARESSIPVIEVYD